MTDLALLSIALVDPALLSIALAVLSRPLHGTAPSPLPHWLLLVVVVPTLWFGIGATVLALDRLLQRFGL